MLAIVCPGQGSQTPGFLAPWLELPGVRESLGFLGECAGLDLVRHGTTSDAETIRDTAVAQPLIVGAGLVVASELTHGPMPAGALSGHSVGEITAAALAGVVQVEDAMRLVGTRGRAMAAASRVAPTGMSAVLGGDPEQVLARLDELGLTAANLNGAGQVVAAGTLAQLGALRANPPAKAKVIELQVAGAFHTHHMAPAVPELEQVAATIEVRDPQPVVLSNRDGEALASGCEVLARLVQQVSNPVRWDLVMARLGALGCDTLVELAPAGTLTNLAKRALPGVRTIAVKTPADLDTVRELVAGRA